VSTTISTSTVDPTTTNKIPSSGVTTTFTTTTASISIDRWDQAIIQIDDSVKVQTQAPAFYAQKASDAAYAIEKVVDTSVNTLFASLASAVYGSDGQTFTDDILVAMMEVLDEADVPRSDRAIIADPSMLADCYKIDKFMSYDYGKNPLGHIPSEAGTGGYRGTIVAYNLPLYITNNLVAPASAGAYGALLHKDAIGLVIQSAPSIEKDRSAAAASDLLYVRCLSGDAIVRDTFGYCFYTRKA